MLTDNFNADMGLDETYQSNGEVYAIMTNKVAHGGNGASTAMVRGEISGKGSVLLKKDTRDLNGWVENMTTDLSSAMMHGF